MKNTRCLFDEQAMTPEGMVSVSQLQTFMSCPKKWEYNYIEGITPRVERPFLGIGKLCHRGMEAAMRYTWEHEREQVYHREIALASGLQAIKDEHRNYVESNSFLPEEMPDVEQMLKDAEDVFEQAFREFDIDRYEVATVLVRGKKIPALELHFVMPCTGSKGLHGYIDAILVEKETGLVWCTDYKFRKTLAPDEDEAVNVQNAVYIRACAKMGLHVTGTMTWQHLNTPAAIPQLLKNGGVSKAKIKTTWEKYVYACEVYGVDPEPYREEMQEKLADIEWFRATYEYRNEETIANIWNQVIVPAARTINKARSPKTVKSRFLYPWNCKMCQYKDLCQAELRNHDADFLRQTEYVKRGTRAVEGEATENALEPAT